MPKVETSLADEILVTAAGRKRGGQPCFTCVGLNEKQRRAIREANDRGASYRAIHEHIVKQWNLPSVTFHSIRQHLANGHDR